MPRWCFKPPEPLNALKCGAVCKGTLYEADLYPEAIPRPSRGYPEAIHNQAVRRATRCRRACSSCACFWKFMSLEMCICFGTAAQPRVGITLQAVRVGLTQKAALCTAGSPAKRQQGKSGQAPTSTGTKKAALYIARIAAALSMPTARTERYEEGQSICP